MTDRILAGRHAVVTGGGKGIGEAIARALSSAGARLTIMGRDAAALTLVSKSLQECNAIELDVTDAASVTGAFTGLGSIDILVNNAGAAHSAPFGKTNLEDWSRMMAVNVTGAFSCIQAALPSMKASAHGRIVTVASTAALHGYAYSSAYCASKHALLGLTRALAVELSATPLTVNAVCPGFTETSMLDQSIERIVQATGRSKEQARASLAAMNPGGRFVQPSEVAATVLWLCSDAASSVTGQAIEVPSGEVN